MISDGNCKKRFLFPIGDKHSSYFGLGADLRDMIVDGLLLPKVMNLGRSSASEGCIMMLSMSIMLSFPTISGSYCANLVSPRSLKSSPMLSSMETGQLSASLASSQSQQAKNMSLIYYGGY